MSTVETLWKVLKIDMCSNDLLHKALGFQKMSIQKVSANDFLDY